MKAGGPIYVHGAGVQLLTVGTWAGCPADSGYIRAEGSSCLQWVHEGRGSNICASSRGAATYSGYVGWVSS